MQFMDEAAKAQWASEVVAMQKKRAMAYELKIEELNAKGMLTSSVTPSMLYHEGANSLQELSSLWIPIFQSFWKRVRPLDPDPLAQQAKEDVQHWFEIEGKVISDEITRIAATKNLSGGTSPAPYDAEVQVMVTVAIAACQAEIENQRTSLRETPAMDPKPYVPASSSRLPSGRPGLPMEWVIPVLSAFVISLIVSWLMTRGISHRQDQLDAQIQEVISVQQALAGQINAVQMAQNKAATPSPKKTAPVKKVKPKKVSRSTAHKN